MKEQHLSRGELSFMKLNLERIPSGAKPTSTNIYCREMLRKHTCLKEELHHSRRYMHMLLYEQHTAHSRDWDDGVVSPCKKKKNHSTSQHFLDERRQHKIWKNCSWTHWAWLSVACPASAITLIFLTKCITVVLKLNTDISFQTKWCAEAAGEVPDMKSADLKAQCGAYFSGPELDFLRVETWDLSSGIVSVNTSICYTYQRRWILFWTTVTSVLLVESQFTRKECSGLKSQPISNLLRMPYYWSSRVLISD